MWKRNLLFLVLCVGGLAAIAANIPRPAQLSRKQQIAASGKRDADFDRTLERLNASFQQDWAARKLVPAGPADDLLIARRLALGLTGTIPSLEEIRALETIPPERRLEQWIDRLLVDRRYHDYFAERLARAYVGVEDGPLILFRRRRMVRWLSDQLRDNRPYDALVRELIVADGFSTSQPATNFLTHSIPKENSFHVDERKLAARVSRAFLGMRIDCAECHDHPFERWKQTDFEGLAAFFAGTRERFTGLADDPGEKKLEVEDRTTGKLRKVSSAVPFERELLPAGGAARTRLAAWVTHPQNEHFSQAIVNRVWALLLGRGLVDPVDDIRPGQPVPPALATLADDFSKHAFDLRRLIRLVAASEPFRIESRANPAIPDHEITPQHEAAWAAFPVARLRTEQVAGAIEQAASLETLDAETHVVLRFQISVERNTFNSRFGDAGEDELNPTGGTIPQALLLMNGAMVKNRTQGSPLYNASSQIALLASGDREAIEVAYLATLTRRPTRSELEHFVARLAVSTGRDRTAKLEDLCWTLVNSVEFSWNH